VCVWPLILHLIFQIRESSAFDLYNRTSVSGVVLCVLFCAMAVAERKSCWADMVDNGEVDDQQTDDLLSASFGVAKERPSISPPVTTLVFRGLHVDACLILY
jgi:hypothetical protein